MRYLLSIMLSVVLWLTSYVANAINLGTVRANYQKVISDKTLCKSMITELEKTRNNSVTHLAYLGSMQTIWANHIVNPISKLNTFNAGKKNIEHAIKNAPNNVELRFIRLSVQKNAPSFLGYDSNIKEDTEFIRKYRHQITLDVLQKNIDNLLNQ